MLAVQTLGPCWTYGEYKTALAAVTEAGALLPETLWAQRGFRVQTVEYLHRGNEILRPKSEHDIHSCSHAPCVHHSEGKQRGVLCNFMPRKVFLEECFWL